MENCIGIINNTNLESEFGVLCKNRPVYMLPFGGRYRIVDFIISNMVNNGIKTVALYTGEKIRSTMDHLGDGKPWNLNSRFQGLFLYPPISQSISIERLGDVADFYSTLDFIEESRGANVFIAPTNIIFMANLTEEYKYFNESGADVTLFYKRIKDESGYYINSEKLHYDENRNVINIGVNLGTESEFDMYMDTMFIKKEVLLKIIKETVEKGNASSLKEALLLNSDKLKMNVCEITETVMNIKDTQSYYRANMQLLEPEIYKSLFIENGRVMTKTKDEPSTMYTNRPQVENSLLANGCVIEGDVENSIIFRGVKIGADATVKNSIIMQKATIEEGAVVVNSILDKYSIVDKDSSLVGNVNQPYVLGKRMEIKKDQL